MIRVSYHTIGRLPDQVEPVAVEILGRVMSDNQSTKTRGEWRLQPIDYHVYRAMAHLKKWGEEDKSDTHLRNAFCRLMFAVVLDKERGNK